MNSKGVNPVIAAILLIVITIAIGGMYAGWMQEFYTKSLQAQKETSDRQIFCKDAGFTIYSCTYDQGDTNMVTVVLESSAPIDLNSFDVIAVHSDGRSDHNNCEVGLEEHATGVAYVRVTAGKSLTRVKVTSTDCPEKSDSVTSCT